MIVVLQNLSSSKAAGDADDVVAIAKTAGFVISAEELQKAQAEVSEEELEGVSGGLTDFYSPAVRKVVAWIFDHGGGDVEVTNAALQRGRQG